MTDDPANSKSPTPEQPDKISPDATSHEGETQESSGLQPSSLEAPSPTSPSASEDTDALSDGAVSEMASDKTLDEAPEAYAAESQLEQSEESTPQELSDAAESDASAESAASIASSGGEGALLSSQEEASQNDSGEEPTASDVALDASEDLAESHDVDEESDLSEAELSEAEASTADEEDASDKPLEDETETADGQPADEEPTDEPTNESTQRADEGLAPDLAQDAAEASAGRAGQVGAVAKSATVWTLKNSVQALNWAVLKLEAAKSGSENRETLPSGGEWVERLWVTVQPILIFVSLTTTRSLNSLLTWSLQRLDADALPKSTPEVEAEVPTTSLLTNLSRTLTRAATPLLKQLWRLWLRLLAIVRDRLLPERLKPLSDLTLTTFAAIVLAGVLWLAAAITPDRAPSMAQEPPSSQASSEITSSESSSSNSSTSSQDLASVKKQLAEVTVPYTSEEENLIKEVTTNMKGDRLVVTLGLDWYRLSETQQDRLAQDLLEQTQKLDFKKLDVLDPDRSRIARSPVVGDAMIIFSRTTDRLPEKPAPLPDASDGSSILDSSDLDASEASPQHMSGPTSANEADSDNANNGAEIDEFEESTELTDDLADEAENR